MAAVGSNSYANNLILMEVDAKSSKTHLKIDPHDPTRLSVSPGVMPLSHEVYLLIKKSLMENRRSGFPTNHLYRALDAKYGLGEIFAKIHEENKERFIPGYVKYDEHYKVFPDTIQSNVKMVSGS